MSNTADLTVSYWPDDCETERVVDLRTWASHDPDDTRLRESFAESVRHCTGPLGTWRTEDSCTTYLKVTKRFVKWLATKQIASVGQLTPGVWNDYTLHLQSGSGSKIATSNGVRLQLRQSLVALPGASDAFLSAVARRIGTNQTGAAKHRYTCEEFVATKAAARRVVRAAHARITANWSLMLVDDPEAAALTDEQSVLRDALRLLFSEGSPVSRSHMLKLGGWVRRADSKGHLIKAPTVALSLELLWLSPAEAMAAAVWLVTLTGENRAVVDRKTLPSSAASLGDKEAIAFTRDWKFRRKPANRFQPSPWRTEAGEDSAGRALRVIANACAPARTYLGARQLSSDRLIYFRSPMQDLHVVNADRTLPKAGLPKNGVRMSELCTWWPWHGTDGPRLNFIALRNTYETATWRINPNLFGGGHDLNQQLEYRKGDPAQVEMAHDHVVEAMRSASDQADEYSIWQPDAVTPRNKDMVGVSCDDWRHNPRTQAPCGECFLQCFDCSNGCITPRHLPVDVLILDGLENLRATISPKRWANRYSRFYGPVLSALNLAGVDQTRRVFLRGQTTEAQREKVQRAFRGDYDAPGQFEETP